jgi:outer membrane protein insertion porin family
MANIFIMNYLGKFILIALLGLPIALGAQEALVYELAGIQVHGCKRTAPAVVRQMSGLRAGDKIQLPGNTIPQAVRRLLQQQLFSDVQIVQEKTEMDLVWLSITVEEAPLLEAVTVNGLSRRKNEEWVKWLKQQHPLKTSWLPAGEAQLKSAIHQRLEEEGYAPEGYVLTSGITAGGIALVVQFDKPQKQKLIDIHWDGVSQQQIKGLNKAIGVSRWRKIVFSSVEQARIRSAVLHYYRDQGYVDAAITQDSSWQNERNQWHWQLKIEEGAPYYIGTIGWKGAHRYDTSLLAQVLEIKAGDPYRPSFLDKKLHFDPENGDLSGLYMDNGHLFFKAEAIVTSLRGHTVDIEIQLQEGPVAIISEVNITGNERTNEHVIRRELRTQPGEPFSREEVLRSQRALINLGYFKPETMGIRTDVDPESGMVAITYDVEEDRNDKFELAASLNPGSGNGVGMVGTLGFTFNNFSLRQLLAGDWRSAHGDGQQLSIRAQSSGLGFQSYNLSFLEPWFKGKPQSLGFSVFHQRFAEQDSLENWETLSVTGANLRLGQRLPWGNGGWTLNSELGYQYIRLDNLLSIDLDDGTALSSGKFQNIYTQLKLAYRNINDPFFPRQGGSFEASGQWTPPWQRTFDGEGNEQFSRLAYHKYRIQGEKYFPLGRKAVLKTSAKMGWLMNYRANQSTSPFERFELGGNGMTGSQQAAFVGNDLLSLRGYDLNDIPGSVGGGGAAFSKFTAEVRYPLFNSGAARGYVLGFAEAGNSWKSVQDFNPFDLYRSAGLGVRFQLPMFGTIGFDYGLGFDQPGFQLKEWQQYGTFNLILGFEPE